ncbi:MAG: N-acetylneuraminate synthase family protein [Nitrosopumilus sp.]|nr:N-acetylneuraminate synthase family protein [Nitrosopumilus sp.]
MILDDPSHTFVIAEAGSNWKCGIYNEDLEQAKKLIKIASEAGADAVKFQTFRSSTIYAKDAGKSEYLSKLGVKDDINELFDYLSMPYEMIPKLSDYCKELNIEFMSSAFSVEDAKVIDPFVNVHKVASFELNHVRLLEFLAKTNKPIILSTGASTFSEIDFAVNTLKKYGNENFILMQCTSKYPCPTEFLNLSVIPNLQLRYDCTMGFSDHSEDPVISPLLAIGYGVTLIEKHFTLNKNLPGPDHKVSLSPEELSLMIKSIRLADLSKGNGQKTILPIEKELHDFACRSLQAIKPIKKGEILMEGINFEVLRPGSRKRGLDAKFLDDIIGKKSTEDINIGDGIINYE